MTAIGAVVVSSRTDCDKCERRGLLAVTEFLFDTAMNRLIVGGMLKDYRNRGIEFSSCDNTFVSEKKRLHGGRVVPMTDAATKIEAARHRKCQLRQRTA